MSDTAIIVNTVVAVLATVLLIVRFRLNPVLSLVIGAAYLGLTAVDVLLVISADRADRYHRRLHLRDRPGRRRGVGSERGVSVASVVAILLILPMSLVF